jgi:hypothetical protein
LLHFVTQPRWRLSNLGFNQAKIESGATVPAA